MKTKRSIIFLLILLSLFLTLKPVFAATNSGGHGHSSKQSPSVIPEHKSLTVELDQNKVNGNANTNEHSNMDMSEMEMEQSAKRDSSNSEGHDEISSSGGHGTSTDSVHGEESTGSEGVNWPIVGGFLVINTIVIAIAGVLKLFNKKSPISMVRE